MFQTFTLMDASQAASLLEQVRQLEFAEGKPSASGVAARRKNNRQARPTPQKEALALQVVNALQHHAGVLAYALPRYYAVPIFNLAGQGEHYGAHIDMAGMVGMHGWPMRTDLSYTLFLAPPMPTRAARCGSSCPTAPSMSSCRRGAWWCTPAP